MSLECPGLWVTNKVTFILRIKFHQFESSHTHNYKTLDLFEIFSYRHTSGILGGCHTVSQTTVCGNAFTLIWTLALGHHSRLPVGCCPTRHHSSSLNHYSGLHVSHCPHGATSLCCCRWVWFKEKDLKLHSHRACHSCFTWTLVPLTQAAA